MLTLMSRLARLVLGFIPGRVVYLTKIYGWLDVVSFRSRTGVLPVQPDQVLSSFLRAKAAVSLAWFITLTNRAIVSLASILPSF